MFTMTTDQLAHIFARFPTRRVAVIGDFALDVYWKIQPDAAQTSVETHQTTCPISQQSYAAGAAGNVAADLSALGCNVAVFGVIGDDLWGRELSRILQHHTVNTTGLICQEKDWSTVTYIKPHIHGAEQHRFDVGDFNRLHARTAKQVLAALSQALPALDAVVINAQAIAGIHVTMLQKQITDLIASHPHIIFTIDSRDPQTLYPGGLLKINNLELAQVCKAAAPLGPKQLSTALIELQAQRQQAVFVTCGEQGIMACDQHGITKIAGITGAGEIDTTGAGDAAMAGITTALASGATPAAAAFIGNLAAAVCIRKLQQTGTATPAEMLALIAT